MAFAITQGDALQPDIYDFSQTVADQTATPGTGINMLKKYNKFRATIFYKTATAASVVSLQVADDAGFTSNVRTIAQVSFIITVVQAAVLVGVAPDGGKQFVRIVQSAAGTLDARLEAGL